MLEVGVSAGLCLYPERYGYRYSDRAVGTGEPILECAATGMAPPSKLPEVEWRAGLDLNPLDVTDAADIAWLDAPYNETMRGDWPGISAFLRVGEDVFHTYSTYGRGIEQFHNGIPYLDLTALGRQEEWEEPKGRAVPLGRQVGGPGMRLPDEYDTDT